MFFGKIISDLHVLDIGFLLWKLKICCTSFTDCLFVVQSPPPTPLSA